MTMQDNPQMLTNWAWKEMLFCVLNQLITIIIIIIQL